MSTDHEHPIPSPPSFNQDSMVKKLHNFFVCIMSTFFYCFPCPCAACFLPLQPLPPLFLLSFRLILCFCFFFFFAALLLSYVPPFLSLALFVFLPRDCSPCDVCLTIKFLSIMQRTLKKKNTKRCSGSSPCLSHPNVLGSFPWLFLLTVLGSFPWIFFVLDFRQNTTPPIHGKRSPRGLNCPLMLLTACFWCPLLSLASHNRLRRLHLHKLVGGRIGSKTEVARMPFIATSNWCWGLFYTCR